MQIFTYENYCENLKVINLSCIGEQEEEYKYENSKKDYKEQKIKIHHAHDKLFRDILNDKEIVSNFINNTLNLKIKIKENELEEVNTNFITKEYDERRSDIIYKHKKENLYFLIEHQSTVNNLMLFRIFEYCMEIMRKVINESNSYIDDIKYPQIIPIVIYTGTRKYSAKTDLLEAQETLRLDNRQDVIVRYNLVNINDYSKKELLNKNSLLYMAMAIEKCKTKEQLIDITNNIVNKIKDLKTKEKMIRIIKYMLKDAIGEDKANELIKKLREGKEEMSMLKENLMKEREKILNQGRKEGMSMLKENLMKEREKILNQGRKEGMSMLKENLMKERENILKQGRREEKETVIKNMLEYGIKIEDICKITNTNKQKVQKLMNT